MLVHGFLEKSTERFPDKIALICGGRRLTYAEVETQANRLAHALIDRGIRRGDRVAVYLPNSCEAVIAIFGILKAAGTFVVINPTTRKDKLAYILNNCRAAALITTDRNAEIAAQVHASVPSLKFTVLVGQQIPDAEGQTELFVAFRDAVSAFPYSQPPCQAIDQDLACLIYTSGSTGEPKGVMSGHNNVVFVSGSIIT